MAGVFDIDLDQPEEVASDEELEEGVRPGGPPQREPQGEREKKRSRSFPNQAE